MAKTIRKKLIYLVIVLFSFFFLSTSLGKVPVHLNQDELMFGLNAHSISNSLQDYYGNKLPFYFWHLGSFWATPVVVYLGSFVLAFLPIAESSIRLTSVLIGAVSTLLMFALVKNLFDKKLALLSAVILLASPVFFIHSRILLDNLYPVPFVLLWLFLLKKYLDKNNLMYLFGSLLSLGVGIHSYHAAKIMMPIYFLATIFILLKSVKEKKKAIATATVAFLIPIIAFLPWLKEHPDTLLNQVSYVGSIDRTIDAQKGFFGVFSFKRVGTVLSSYPSYLGPRILFVEGDRSLIHSTGRVGAFLFPMIILLVFGILEVLYKKKDLFSKLILFGLLTYPIAPSIVNDPQRISRGLVAIPFAVVLFVYGVQFLLKSKKKMFRHLLFAILILSVFEFGIFWNDYFGKYRQRSYAHFNYDIGGALESAFRSTQARDVDKVFLDNDIPFVSLYSDFYQKKLEIDVSEKVELFDYSREEFSDYPSGSLFVVKYNNVPRSRDKMVGEFERIEIIREPDGTESFYVFYRTK